MSTPDGDNGRGDVPAPVVVDAETDIPPLAEIPDVDELYSPPVWTEEQTARMMLLFVSLGLFGLTIFLSFIVVATGSDSTWERTSDLLGTIIPVETLIIGAAVSYYFKSASSD